jgi:hypothetical protein
MLIAVALALAESAAPPLVNVQRFRPSIDAERTTWVDDSTVGEEGRFTGRLLASYTRDPLVYVYADGRVEPVVANLVQLDTLAGYTVGRVRVGLAVPVILRSFGGTSEDVTEVGDVAVELKGAILRREAGRVGLAAYGRLGLPTGLADGLSSDGFTGELGAVLDGDLGAVRLQGGASAILVPVWGFQNVTWGPQLDLRVGAGWAVTGDFGLAVDLDASTPFGGGEVDAAFPAEVLLGGWGRVGRSGLLRVGVGSGLTSGIGAPDLRAVVGIGFEPRPRRDRDGDEVWDDEDRCPDDPEDADRWEDDDGCPEGTRLTLRFVDAETGAPVEGVTSGIAGTEAAGDRDLTLAAAGYPLVVQAPGYEDVRITVDVPPGRPVVREVRLRRAPARH